MKKKKLFILTFLLLISFVFINKVFAIEDSIPPTLNSISLNKTSYDAGENIRINVDALDNLSGVGTIMIEWCLDENNCSNKNHLVIEKNNITSQQFEINYTVPINTLPGVWHFSCIQIWDNQGNLKSYYKGDNTINLDNMDMTIVNNNDIDIEAPVLNNLRILNDNVSSPGEVQIEAEVTDNVSQNVNVQVDYAIGRAYKDNIQYIIDDIIYSDNVVNTVSVTLTKNSNGKYVGTLYLDNRFIKYTIAEIRLEDESSNIVYYSSDVDKYKDKYGDNYEVLALPNNVDEEVVPSNYVADTTAPEIASYTYSKNTASIPDTITVNMNVNENQSGLSISTIYFRNESGTYKEGFSSFPGASSDEISFRLDFNQNGKIQSDEKIYMYRVSLCDVAENCKVYTLDDGDFEKKVIDILK